MQDLVKAASLALSGNDAEALERLAAEARGRCDATAVLDLDALRHLDELRRAAQVLAAQVHAAALNLDLRSRGYARTSSRWKASPWDL